MPDKSVIVIGSGFAGLAAASFMAKQGWRVTVIEKNETPGGRARQLKQDGFSFDMGPSFYWMPDIFEHFFAQFGKKPSDYYQLKRLDPSYRIYWNKGYNDIPADKHSLVRLFESIEAGAGKKLIQYLSEAREKYEIGMKNLVYKPSLSVMEFMNWPTIKGILRMDVFSSVRKHIYKYFKHPHLRQIMEFPILFLGALPQNTPALYSLMNYADLEGGTWYPEKGMYSVVNAMHQLATELGVVFHFSEEAKEIIVEHRIARKLVTDKQVYSPDVIISGADYHHTEMFLLPPKYRTYSQKYWDNRTMAPSCLMYYVGLNKKLKQPIHHSLFFDVSFEKHGDEIYKNPQWPTEPLFYVSVSTVTDKETAPEGMENLVFLVPVASGLKGDTEDLREKYFNKIVKRMEDHLGEPVRDFIVFRKTYSVSDFVNDYNSFRGNAYGLANTLRQTALLRPSCRSKKIKNLFYTGQLTVPGPGVPPSLVSGEVVAKEVNREFK